MNKNYPLLCMVSDDDSNNHDVHFAMIIGESPSGYFVDNNCYAWVIAEPVTPEQLANPIVMLEGNKQYDHITIAPKPKDEWDNMDKINDFNEWHK